MQMEQVSVVDGATRIHAVNEQQQQPISEKAIKFRVLAEHRVTRLVRLIGQLGNLSRRSTYSYTATETAQMFKALRAALDGAEAKFADKQNGAFRFED